MEINFCKSILEHINDGVYIVDTQRNITYWNRGAELISGYSGEEVLGRSCADNIMIHVDGQGANLCGESCIVSQTLASGIETSTEAYLKHKQGHRVPVRMQVIPIVKAGKITGAAEIFTQVSARAAFQARIDELEKLAYVDPLTLLANRRFTELSIEARLDELKRYQWPFGLVFIDVDHFKDINDTYGHKTGDKVLSMVARTLMESSRSFDLAGRWSGDEFIVIMPRVDSGQLAEIANRFRALVESSALALGSEVVRVTVSVGATLARGDDTGTSLVDRADQLMYQSKAKGRNFVSSDA